MLIAEGKMNVTEAEEVCPLDIYDEMVRSLTNAGYSPYGSIDYRPLDIDEITEWEGEIFSVIWVHDKAVRIEQLKSNVQNVIRAGNTVKVVYKIPEVKKVVKTVVRTVVKEV